MKQLEYLKPNAELIGKNVKLVKLSRSLRLKRLRQNEGLTPAKLGEKVGLSRQTVEAIEKGATNYTIEPFLRLEMYFGLITQQEINEAKNISDGQIR